MLEVLVRCSGEEEWDTQVNGIFFQASNLEGMFDGPSSLLLGRLLEEDSRFGPV